MLFPLKKPLPDFESLIKVIKGERESKKVHFVELLIDHEVQKVIVEDLMGEKWVPPARGLFGASGVTENEEASWKQNINFYYRMGYDYLPDIDPILRLQAFFTTSRIADDTASISKGKRIWAEEGKGMISSWEDLERFPWKKIEEIKFALESYYDFLSRNLPEGMKVLVILGLYEPVLEFILGYEGLFYLLYDQPDLVKEVFNRLGNIVYDIYKSIVSLQIIGGIFHADDLGFKTSTMLSPKYLREIVFPWFKKYSFLAHENGKIYMYHCCGYKSEIIEDLIEDVRIDALHSFEDICCPIIEFKKRYGRRIAVLGGVDMDKLCRLDEKDLREYIRKILEECVPGGRFALGSGNSIANYVPIKNYLTMLDEGLKWR
jgi:uroporphyrinogen decarboxylase